MNNTLIFILCYLTTFCRITNAETTLEQLVSMAAQREYRGVGGIADNAAFFLSKPAFKELVQEVSQKPAYFSEAATVRPLTESEQNIVIIAAWSLPDDLYLIFAQDAVAETRQGRMSLENLQAVLWPGGRANGFLNRHQTNPEVKNMMQSAKRLFPAIPYFANRIDPIIDATELPPPPEEDTEMVEDRDGEVLELAELVKRQPLPRSAAPPQSSAAVFPWVVIGVATCGLSCLVWLLMRKRLQRHE